MTQWNDSDLSVCAPSASVQVMWSSGAQSICFSFITLSFQYWNIHAFLEFSVCLQVLIEFWSRSVKREFLSNSYKTFNVSEWAFLFSETSPDTWTATVWPTLSCVMRSRCSLRVFSHSVWEEVIHVWMWPLPAGLAVSFPPCDIFICTTTKLITPVRFRNVSAVRLDSRPTWSVRRFPAETHFCGT